MSFQLLNSVMMSLFITAFINLSCCFLELLHFVVSMHGSQIVYLDNGDIMRPGRATCNQPAGGYS